ncbi:hypothetical protein LTR27_000582 [Elasticomyces elasticus]|nr:hypothetical protein LTR27_000582 [Elasticomyces elasticus]
MPGHCIDISIVWYVNSAMTLTADAILILLPVPDIVRLQLPRAQKAALLLVFSLGIFVMACTTIRCVALGPVVSQRDLFYYQASAHSWTFLEVDVSIICAALPVLRAPLSKLFPRILGRLATQGPSARQHHGVRSGGQLRSTSGISMQDRSEWHKGGQSQVRGVRDTLDDDAASDEERILSPHAIRKTMEVFQYDQSDVPRPKDKGSVDRRAAM